METNIISYAGMLDQGGFRQWYTYQKLRAQHRFTPGEVSFLMGKPPFHFEDYAMLSSGAKLDAADIDALAELFQGTWPRPLDFHRDENSGVFEKRIVRVRQTDGARKIQWRIAIPWKLKGKESQHGLTFCEEKRSVPAVEANQMHRRIDSALNALASQGFFRSRRSPLEVYHEVEENCQWPLLLRPDYVKEALYRRIGWYKLALKTNYGRLYFQDS